MVGPAKTLRKPSKPKVVNLRIHEATLGLIDKAAHIQGRSRSDFMIEASRLAAEMAILDQRVIKMSPESYDHFLAVLDHPPEPNDKLVELLRSKAPWER